MPKLNEILPYRRKVEGLKFGIECEVEGQRLPGEVGPLFIVEADGSLRNGGLEYVFAKPLDKGASLKALEHLFGQLVKNKSKVDYSFRTSTHVHVNVSDIELKKVLNIIFLYTLVEDLFVNFCEEHRRGNRFALRFKEAERLYEVLRNLVTAVYSGSLDNMVDTLSNIQQNYTKYAALNMYTLVKYGTLEFRSLEGTNDLQKISKWIDAIENIVQLGKEFESIEDLHQAFFNDPEAIINAIFTEEFKFHGWQRAVEESYSQAYQVVLTSKGI